MNMIKLEKEHLLCLFESHVASVSPQTDKHWEISKKIIDREFELNMNQPKLMGHCLVDKSTISKSSMLWCSTVFMGLDWYTDLVIEFIFDCPLKEIGKSIKKRKSKGVTRVYLDVNATYIFNAIHKSYV